MTDIHLGTFASREDAMAAAEVEDALCGNTEPLEWITPPVYTSKPAPGHVYHMAGPVLERWFVSYSGPQDTWVNSYATQDAAVEACDADWDQRDEMP